MAVLNKVFSYKDFTVVKTSVIKDKNISWKAKGLLIYLLSLPDKKELNTNEISEMATDGETSFRSGMEELKKAGYIKYEKKNKNGQFKHFYTINEKPNE